MPVDMYRTTFLKRLREQKPFVPLGAPRRDHGEVPAWRSIFTALAMEGHGSGYKLFGFDEFSARLKNAYVRAKPSLEKSFGDEDFKRWVSVWYESGMQETYVYTALIDMIEDKAKCGVVLYDSRADWKFKADCVVLIGAKSAKIDVFTGTAAARAAIEARRDANERLMKANNAESSHWKNVVIEALPKCQVPVDLNHAWNVNGLRLPTKSSIDNALRFLYDLGAIPSDNRFFLDASAARP